MKKNILAIVPALMPSVNIGIINPMQYLQQQGKINFKVTLPYLFKHNMLTGIDCIIFCRNSFPSEEWILNEIISLEIPYIYEIDDNFFEIPYNNPLGRLHRHPIQLSSFIDFIQNASIVRTYSHVFAEDIKNFNSQVEINTVYFDTKLIEDLKQNKAKKLKIIYATSRMADEQQSIFTEALSKIALKYQEEVEIYFWGAPIVDKDLKELKNVYYLESIYNYKKFIKKFYEIGFDIGLAPIFEGRFFNSKTNNKYREYGACKIAGIYSNEDLYSNCVVDGKNGLLVENTPQSWYDGIEKLINNEELRTRIISHANQDIQTNYSFERYCDVWLQTINNALSLVPSKKICTRSLLKRNSYVHFILLYDDSIEKSILEKLIKKLQNEIYFGLETILVDKNDLYPINEIVKNNLNLIVVSNDIEVIDSIHEICKKNKLILLTELDFISKDIPTIKISNSNANVYENYKKNIYLKIHNAIYENFTQQEYLPWIKRKLLYVKHLLLKNFAVRKIRYFISKKNSLKLKLHTIWTIYKINKGK